MSEATVGPPPTIHLAPGAMVTASIFRSPSPARHARRAAEALLGPEVRPRRHERAAAGRQAWLPFVRLPTCRNRLEDGLYLAAVEQVDRGIEYHLIAGADPAVDFHPRAQIACLGHFADLSFAIA